MLKQKYGRSHSTYSGYRRRGTSGRCTKCAGLLSRVSKLPPEIKQMIFGQYKKNLIERSYARKYGYLRFKGRR